MPEDFGSQCRLVWQNIELQLRAADMSLDNVVKVSTFLSDRRYAIENSQIRQEVLLWLRSGPDRYHHRHFRQEMAGRD